MIYFCVVLEDSGVGRRNRLVAVPNEYMVRRYERSAFSAFERRSFKTRHQVDQHLTWTTSRHQDMKQEWHIVLAGQVYAYMEFACRAEYRHDHRFG
jgi:hypothetical protein